MRIRNFMLALLLIIGLSNIQAQEATTTAGGEANGSGGSLSYTVGQTVYSTQTGTSGNSVFQGIQLPYEIFIASGIAEAQGINLSVSAYPNPTIDYLTLKVENYETANLQYQVFNINGKLLQVTKATGQKTVIEMAGFISANYFVKVIDNKKEIKAFKIIKH